MPYLSRLQHSLLRTRLPKPYLPIKPPPADSEAYDDYEKSSRDSLLGNDGLVSPMGQRYQPWWQHGRLLLVIHGIIIAGYVAVLTAVVHRRSHDSHRRNCVSSCERDIFSTTYGMTANRPTAPAAEAIRWEIHKFTLEDRIQDHGGFSGRPSPQLDRAWHDLLNCTYSVRPITEQGASTLNESFLTFLTLDRRKHHP
jgi:hypothetical protein